MFLSSKYSFLDSNEHEILPKIVRGLKESPSAIKLSIVDSTTFSNFNS